MKENVDPEHATATLLQTQCGTAKYMAPETIVRNGKGYNGEKVDAWECGMVLYALLAGYLPFNGEDDNSVFQSILRGKLKFPSHFSPGAKDILRKLLEKDPEKRMSLPEVREHLWFLVDYKGDASNLSVPKMAHNPRDAGANAMLEGLQPQNGAAKGPGSEKAKLGQAMKKSKSRSRLSQKIRQGTLKVEALTPTASELTSDASPEVKLVPKNKSTVRFVRDAGGRPGSDVAAVEEMVDIETPKGSQPSTPFGDDTNQGLSGGEQVPLFQEAPGPRINIASSETLATGGISASKIVSVDRPATGNESPGKGPQAVKKPSRISAASNMLKVPNLGIFFSDSQKPLVSKPSDALSERELMALPSCSADGDEDGASSVRSRLRTPLSSMFKSMLSTSVDGQVTDTVVNEKPGAQSSWFAGSPVSEAGSPRVGAGPNDIDRMMSEDKIDSRVTSFNFLKRPKGAAKKRGDPIS